MEPQAGERPENYVDPDDTYSKFSAQKADSIAQGLRNDQARSSKLEELEILDERGQNVEQVGSPPCNLQILMTVSLLVTRCKIMNLNRTATLSQPLERDKALGSSFPESLCCFFWTVIMWYM